MALDQMRPETMLSPYRILDLTDEKGFLCGRILGDLGADVIKIERPGGDPSRNTGPFYHNDSHRERSLYWWAYNCNKQGITLDLEKEEGREIFQRLVKKSHAVIESSPCYLNGLGLGYTTLNEVNPGIVMASISPFGRTGPYKDYSAADLTVWAMGGLMFYCGEPDLGPVAISFHQACLHAGGAAAQGTMIALYHQQLTGEGQHVDVSMLESIVGALMHIRPFWELNEIELRRAGQFRIEILGTGAVARMIWPCQDGYVMFSIMGGTTGAPSNRALFRWMEEEDMKLDEVKRDWEALDMHTATQEDFDQLQRPIAEFFLRHTQAELYSGALERGIMFYPVNTTREITEDVQLEARGFWQDVEHPELGTKIKYPGSFLRSADMPGISRRAPLIGEHNDEIYAGEMGLSRAEMERLRQSGII